MCRCGTEGHGSVVALAALDLTLNLMILDVFSKLNDSYSKVYLLFFSQKYEHF